METTISREHLIRVETPESEITNAWLIKAADNFLKDKLAECYSITGGIDPETAEVKRHKDELMSNSFLALTMGIDENNRKVEVFFNGNSGLVACVKASVT